MTNAENSGHDWSTKTGRAAFDRAVAKELGKKPKARGQIAILLGLDTTDRRAVNAVSAALGRLVVGNKADQAGEKGQRTYTKAARS